ncbi:MAG: MBL fold metallo-hydrolase [Planctomycetaceae bacterium]|nr:MBL fold metallo-hydrolase [Planctomycetaceae bacterium]
MRPLVYRVGEFEVSVVSDGEFRLDGGAMYGMVPRVRWEPEDPPDDRNRVRLGLHCLLVRGPSFTALLETGIGRGWSPEWDDRYGILHPPSLVESLAAVGLRPEEVTHAVLSHLHFDHAGGLRHLPRARLVVQRGEAEAFRDPPAYHRGSYASHRPIPLEGALLLDGPGEPLPGITVRRTGGHTRDHQVVLLRSKGETLAFFGDLVPTVRHLPPLWTMAYDLVPMDVIDRKRDLLEEAAAEGWWAHLYHDRDPRPCRIGKDGKRFVAVRGVPGPGR